MVFKSIIYETHNNPKQVYIISHRFQQKCSTLYRWQFNNLVLSLYGITQVNAK